MEIEGKWYNGTCKRFVAISFLLVFLKEFSNINFMYLVTLIVGFDFVDGLIATIEIVWSHETATLWDID